MACKTSVFWLCRSFSRTTSHFLRPKPNVHSARFSTEPVSLADILNLPENSPPKHAEGGNRANLHESHPLVESRPQHKTEEIIPGATEDIHDITQAHIKTSEGNPTKHNAKDLSKFYTMAPEVVNSLHLPKIFRNEFVARTKALQETAIMVREPGLECMEILIKSTGKNSLASKVLLYGKDGCGKTATFVHALQACHNMNWMIICPVNHYQWNNYFKEITVSVHKVCKINSFVLHYLLLFIL